MLCEQNSETTEHVLTESSSLDPVRQLVLEVYEAFLPSWQVKENMVQLILNHSELIQQTVALMRFPIWT